MIYLYGFTFLLLFISVLFDRKKTVKALYISWKNFYTIFPTFLMIFIFISTVLYFISDEFIIEFIGGDNKLYSMAIASLIGSITLLPGFIAYPLCGVLLQKGVPYMVLAAFTTTVMMVGILTYPLEKAYFGVKVTIIRNIVSFFIAILVALVIGFFFGELL